MVAKCFQGLEVVVLKQFQYQVRVKESRTLDLVNPVRGMKTDKCNK